MNVKVDPKTLLVVARWVVNSAAQLAIVLLIVGALAAIYGFTIPHVPVLARDYQGLSWLLIGFAAWRHAGGRLL